MSLTKPIQAKSYGPFTVLVYQHGNTFHLGVDGPKPRPPGAALLRIGLWDTRREALSKADEVFTPLPLPEET